MRWGLKLLELDFEVQYRAVSKIGHVDALSRHVGAVTYEHSLDKEIVIREQAKDDFCRKQKPSSYSSKSEFFLDNEGAMYRRQPTDRHQLVIPRTLVQKVIKENHNTIFVAHPGVRTHDLISNYWWPSMRSQQKTMCKSVNFAKEEGETKNLWPHSEKCRSQPTLSRSPEWISREHTRKNKYLLTLIDHFSILGGLLDP
jgi:hypothetical protein